MKSCYAWSVGGRFLVLAVVVGLGSCKARTPDAQNSAEASTPTAVDPEPQAVPASSAIAAETLVGRIYEDEMLLRLVFIDNHTVERRYVSHEIAPEKGTYSLSAEGGVLDFGAGPVPFKLAEDKSIVMEEGRTFKVLTDWSNNTAASIP